MTDRPPNAERALNLTRVAWLVSIAAPALLIALLGLVKAASSPAAEFPAPEAPAESTLEEECIEWEEGVVECEPAEEPAETGPYPPEECLLRTARARVISNPSRNRLRLVVGYSTVVPTRAYLDFEMRSGGASLGLGVVRRHLGRSGVLRLRESLGEAQMERAQDATDFLLTVDIPSTPSYCERYYTRRLALKRTVHGQAAWFQSDPAFGPAAE
ncbi:MAG TPA: hypothetical protein VH476_01110 [Solirubrobacterales bacterium]